MIGPASRLVSDQAFHAYGRDAITRTEAHDQRINPHATISLTTAPPTVSDPNGREALRQSCEKRDWPLGTRSG